MDMTDRQYDGMLLDILSDLEDIEAAALLLPDTPEKEKLLEVIGKKKRKTEKKFASPILP